MGFILLILKCLSILIQTISYPQKEVKLTYQLQFTDIALANLKNTQSMTKASFWVKLNNLLTIRYKKSNVKRLVEFDVSYRRRAGNYRIFFERDDNLKIIDIIDILPRDRAYQRNR